MVDRPRRFFLVTFRVTWYRSVESSDEISEVNTVVSSVRGNKNNEPLRTEPDDPALEVSPPEVDRRGQRRVPPTLP